MLFLNSICFSGRRESLTIPGGGNNGEVRVSRGHWRRVGGRRQVWQD